MVRHPRSSAFGFGALGFGDQGFGSDARGAFGLGSALLAWTLLGASVATAQTLNDAIADVYRHNPDLAEARLAVRSAREDRAQALSAYLPSVDVSVRYGESEEESETETSGGVLHGQSDLEPYVATARIVQPLYTGGRRRAQMNLARAGIRGAEQGLRGTEQDVLLQAVEAYVGVRRDAAILRLRTEHVELLTRWVAGFQRRLDLGDASRTDLAQAQSRLAGVQASLASARANLEGARAAYVGIVGEPPGELAPTAPPNMPGSLDEALSQGLASNPSLLEAREGEQAARARQGLARSELMPQISIVGSVERREDDEVIGRTTETTSASAELTMPLFQGGRILSRTRQSRVNAERARARSEAQRRSVETQIVSAWSIALASRAVVQAAHAQAEAAETARRGAMREYELGARSTLDLLNSEQERQDAQIALARAEADEVIAAHRLLAAIGALRFEDFGVEVAHRRGADGAQQ